MLQAKIIKITEFLNYTEISNTGKTLIVGVGNNSGEKLGLIKWIPGWRRYGFMPEQNLQFDVTCLNEISDFMKNLMEERKLKTIKTKLPGLENQDVIESSPLFIKKIL